jgi:hypothetical protein
VGQYFCKALYREEVRGLAVWRQEINFSLNVCKTKELIVNYRKRRVSIGLKWSWSIVSSSFLFTSPTNYHGPNTRQL